MKLAIIDTETTGFGNTDRVVEVGIQQVDRDGRILREFETLINPQRDIGNTHIHGVSAKLVRNAPVFSEVAGHILEVFSDSDFLCAYNMSFDWRMLNNEYSRLGYDLPRAECRCLMQFFSKVDCGAPRKLEDLLAYHGIRTESAHRAIDDVNGTRELLARYLDRFDWRKTGGEPWKSFDFGEQKEPLSRDREESRGGAKGSALSRLMSKLPLHPEDPEMDSYLLLLDDVFSDSVLEDCEAERLFELAKELGMSQSDVGRAHELYLGELLNVAKRDGYISEMEREHLGAVSEALQIPFTERIESMQGLNLYPRDLTGKRVCFTGTFRGTRDGVLLEQPDLIRTAEEAGMTVQKGVTKKLDLLVTADPYTQSSKAKKARDYGIPILAEQVFWNWLGVDVV